MSDENHSRIHSFWSLDRKKVRLGILVIKMGQAVHSELNILPEWLVHNSISSSSPLARI